MVQKLGIKFFIRYVVPVIAVYSLLMLLSVDMQAQTRYLDLSFDQPDSDTTIFFHRAYNYDSDSTDLYFDIYEPYADTALKRPLIIWMHGGFETGTRREDKIVYFSERLAKRGYVCASIDYRGKVLAEDSIAAPQIGAIYIGIQDAKAAIRYFKQNSELYRIDTSRIVLAGMSSGAFVSLHAAYMQQNEVPDGVVDTTKLGLLDENSTVISSSFKAVVNCWGALSDTSWMYPGDIPVINIGGEQDPVIPFETNGYMQGPMSITRTAQRMGIPARLQAFAEAGHGLHMDEPDDQYRYYDVSIAGLAKFLSEQLYGVTEEESKGDNGIFTYPNPVNNFTNVRVYDAFQYQVVITLYDVRGNELLKEDNGIVYDQHYKRQLDMSQLSSGMYFLKVKKENNDFSYSYLLKISKW